jgi:hypothetical protein
MNPTASVRATRLVFEYEGDNVRLVTEQPVEVAAAMLNLTSANEPGFFVDIRDASELTLARVPAPHAFSTSVEVFPDRPDQPIMRTDVTPSKGAFTVLVPTPDEADHATIVSIVAPAPALAGAAARRPAVSDLVSFPLRRNR